MYFRLSVCSYQYLLVAKRWWLRSIFAFVSFLGTCWLYLFFNSPRPRVSGVSYSPTKARIRRNGEDRQTIFTVEDQSRRWSSTWRSINEDQPRSSCWGSMMIFMLKINEDLHVEDQQLSSRRRTRQNKVKDSRERKSNVRRPGIDSQFARNDRIKNCWTPHRKSQEFT